MISAELRQALAVAARAAGFAGGADPGLRPTGVPGQYAASLPLTLGGAPRETARLLAARLAPLPWVETAAVTGPGYVTVTVTPAALAAVAGQVTAAGPDCVTSDALAGVTVAAPPPGDPLAAAGWAQAQAAVRARLTARLAAAAGAVLADPRQSERERAAPPAPPGTGPAEASPRSVDSVTEAVDFAGRDAVLFTLARMIPGPPPRVDPRVIARHVPGNPAYAVRYAHARAASGVRWAASSPGGMTPAGGPVPHGAASLLDALSWLPERVATAARRGRPDEFARYLEDLARVTVDVLNSASSPGDDRLALARAAQTGLGAGLGLLGVSAPDRLLAET